MTKNTINSTPLMRQVELAQVIPTAKHDTYTVNICSSLTTFSVYCMK